MHKVKYILIGVCIAVLVAGVVSGVVLGLGDGNVSSEFLDKSR